MKSIKFKIIALIASSILFISLMIGGVVILGSSQVFQAISVQKVEEYTDMFSLTFNRQLLDVKETAIEVEILVESFINMNQLSEDGYLDDFETFIAPFIEAAALRGTQTQSAYVFFDPILDGAVHDVWYTDLDNTGDVTRQQEFPMSFYENLGPGDEWYTVPKETQTPYWTAPYHGSVEQDEHVIYISHTRPVVVDDVFLGVVGSDYHFVTMLDTIEGFSIYKNGYVFVLDREGKVLVHPTEPMGSDLLTDYDGQYAWIVNEMVHSEKGFIEYEWIDGEDKFMVYNTIENGLKFAIAVEKKEVFDWFYKLQRGVVIISVIVFSIVLLLGLQLSKQITQPIDQLTRHLNEMSQGDYENTLSTKITTSEDEVGLLSARVEIMRKALKNSFDELRDYSKKLEQLVEARSLSLIESHQQLEDAISESEKQSLILYDLNQQLESVLIDMEKTQKQLIETEKIASMNAVLSTVSDAFIVPLNDFKLTLHEMLEHKNSLESSFFHQNPDVVSMTVFSDGFDGYYHKLLDDLNEMKILVERYKTLDVDVVSFKSRFNVKDMIQLIVDSIAFDPKVIVEVLCHPEMMIYSDAAKLTTVLHHLLVNASKYAFEELSSGMIIIDVEVKEQLKINIKDNGCGIDETLLPNLFSSKNTGYGLVIVYNIVTKFFGGSIHCISHRDHGTEFDVSIDLDDDIETVLL